MWLFLKGLKMILTLLLIDVFSGLIFRTFCRQTFEPIPFKQLFYNSTNVNTHNAKCTFTLISWIQSGIHTNTVMIFDSWHLDFARLVQNSHSVEGCVLNFKYEITPSFSLGTCHESIMSIETLVS